jgi:hypothetical protein
MENSKTGIPSIQFPTAFTYCRFLFRLKLLDSASLSAFKGSMLRGLLGTALYKLNCKSSTSCQQCSLVRNCAFSNLFKPDLVIGNKWTTPPFVIYSPTQKSILKKDDVLEFTITLFGKYSRYFDYFLNAFNYAAQLGLGKHRTPYDIEEIKDDISGEWIYKDNKVNKDWKVAHANLAEFKAQPAKNIRLEFLTPVFLKKNKKQLFFPDIKEIINGLIRRVHIISRSIWMDKAYTIEKDFIDVFQSGIYRYDLKYEKSFKTGGLGKNVELSGFSGSIESYGNFSNLVPLFKAGEILHIGARSSYGLGKLRFTVL